MRPLIFAHANSFPAGTYDYLFAQLRARGFAVHALPRFGHDPAYPVTDNWPHLVQQLADFAAQQVQRTGGPVYLVGHSLGGFLSLMAAAQHPALARGVLYDPRWPWHAAAELGETVAVAPQYLRCQPHGLRDLFKPFKR